jgi:NB-ARC domain
VSVAGQAHVDKLAFFERVEGDVRVGDRRAVSWPHRVGVVPQVADGYQRREQAAALPKGVAAGRGGAVTWVLAGLGGSGKTQLAAAHAEELWAGGQLDLLVWITATSRETVLAGYARAAWDVADPPDGEPPEQRAERFLAWLASIDRRWLVVLDDLADPRHLRGLWPRGPGGQALVTTRRQDSVLQSRGRQLIEVGTFTTAEALGYLRARLANGQLDEPAELAEDLGRLPQALAQACSYIRDRQLTCAAYRRRFAQRRVELALPGGSAPPTRTPWPASTTSRSPTGTRQRGARPAGSLHTAARAPWLKGRASPT